ncbi:MAG: T9SS type A sorting domain-containing protein, partial [Flavipsychrobacter sp.]
DTNFNQSKFSSVGVAGFSAGIVTYKHMAIDGSGTPYMVYTDHANGNKATIKKYNGSAWVTVGSAGFSAGAAQYNQIAIDAAGIPYVVYADGTNNNKAAVKKYNGTTWATVGAAGFSAAGAEYTALAIDADGTPYVAYRDSGNSYKATVMKYNGTAWVAVGTPGFSSGSLKGYICIAINKAGEPYVLYSEGHLTNTNLVIGNQVVVKRYNGTTWESVGESTMQNINSDFARLAIDHSGVPYIAYISQSSPYGTLPAMVKRFEDTSWKAVGSTLIGSLPAYNVHYLDISTDDAGNPYLYYDQGVKKFDGTSWKLIGDVPGIVKSGADKTTYLAVDGAGVPYVAGSTINDQAIVQKLELVDVKPVITAQPISDTLCAGGIATYKMVANNAYHYQWQVSTNGGSTFTDVINSTFYSGSTTDSLTIIAPGASYNNNQYRCVVTGTCALMDTTVAANFFVHTPPALTSQPVNRNICPGTVTTFHVGATGTGLKFRWKVNSGSGWTNVPNTGIYSGATSATLTLNAPNASYNGYKYRCLVSGTCTPSVNSAVATLTVSTPVIVATPIMSPNPTVTGQASNTIFLGYGPSSATLTSTVSGGTPGYTYSWTPTTGIASPAAASTLVTPVASTVYTLTATDTKGCIGSSDFSISVVDAQGTNNRVIVCHNGSTISVATSRVANHLSHGDYLGPCTSANKNNSTGSDGDNETGIGTFENLKVYPNPNDGHFTIELPEGVGGGTIVIADVFGKLVKKISSEQQNQLVVDLGSVANGVYMVQVQDNDKIYRAMITVKN